MHAAKKRAAQKTHLVQYRLCRVDHLNNSITAESLCNTKLIPFASVFHLVYIFSKCVMIPIEVFVCLLSCLRWKSLQDPWYLTQTLSICMPSHPPAHPSRT